MEDFSPQSLFRPVTAVAVNWAQSSLRSHNIHLPTEEGDCQQRQSPEEPRVELCWSGNRDGEPRAVQGVLVGRRHLLCPKKREDRAPLGPQAGT